MIRKIDLSGEWGFRADEEMLGIKNEYFRLGANDSIILPTTTSIAHKGKPNPKAEEGFLTDSWAYEGNAWFYRTADLTAVSSEQTVKLYLERTRLTRLWVNGKPIGSRDSLCTPHVYDISEFAGTIAEIAVCVCNTGYPTKGGHMTSPDTQSNWNGITGEISLIIGEKTCISRLDAYPDAASGKVRLGIGLEGTDCAEISVWGASSDGKTVDKQSFFLEAPNSEIIVELGDDASLWSEYSPVIYTLKAAINGSADISEVSFGLRSFTAEGMNFLNNGKKVYLRGKHDGMIFPFTGAAPTDVESWLKVLETSKKWGINHYRFHTCCPPDAAFTAADMLGIYMQPELPFWGTVSDENDENYNAAEQEYLIEEGKRILSCFGNHPSFVMMSLGNELWGSPERLNAILAEYHKFDDRHLYTQGSNNFQFFPNIQPEDDFFSGVRLSRERLIRGSYAMCDAPLGFVQTDQPNTSHSYDSLIFPEVSENSESECTEIEIQYGTGVKKVKVSSASSGLIPSKPIVTHEVGQYCSYPDFSEIKKYNGVLKARNFEIFKERLSKKGMLGLAEKFHLASGKLAQQCYKYEIEAAMRSEYISGFQLLDLQDFSGQGTALVGMLDAFMDKKEFADCLEWCGYCSDAVILAELDSFVVTVGEKLSIPIKFRYMGEKPLIGKKLDYRLSCGEAVIADGELTVPDGFSGMGELGCINLEMTCGGKLTLTLRIDNVRTSGELPGYTCNSYELWAFSKPCGELALSGKSVKNGSTVYMTEDIGELTELLERGEKVLYFPSELRESVRGAYCTDFWCYPMFRSISESMGKELPVGTLGLLIDNDHPSLGGFESEYYSTPQWYNIVSRSKCAVLDDTPSDFLPIVQMIDNFERNHKLGILYEARAGSGKLMVCTSRLPEISDNPEVRSFAISILDYMHSDRFAPSYELDLEKLCLK